MISLNQNKMVRLSDLKVTVRGNKHPIPIPESPIYQSLATNTPDIYENYIKQNGIKKSRTWLRYQETFHQIQTQGFHAKTQPQIQVNGQNVVTNGHHRVSILYFLFGGNLKVHLEKGQISAIY